MLASFLSASWSPPGECAFLPPTIDDGPVVFTQDAVTWRSGPDGTETTGFMTDETGVVPLSSSIAILAATQIVFVDAAVPDREALVRGLPCGDGLGTRVVYLDADRNGVEQIAETLADHDGLAAIHILSHGTEGSLLLGNTLVDANTMEKQADLLRSWGTALAEGGDILLYGCRVAAGAAGVRFLDRLSMLTGADVAASDDPTGSAALEGDWDLEFARGTLEVAPIFDASRAGHYTHVLMFTVVALPDTQKYAEQQLPPFFDQTQWIADHATSNNIAFVSHVGDVVENGALYESEWLFADAAMDILDGTSIPYSVLPGNHDYDIPGTHSSIDRFAGLEENGNEDPALADISFGASRYAGQSWFLGASDDGLNYCQIFRAEGQDYLHIALEWEPRASSVAWAQQQIDAYPQLPVILSTHYYIDPLVDGHFLTTYSDDGYNGQEVFEALVYPNPQIFLVLSGHNTEWHRVDTNQAGFEVIETMTDYQSRPNGGDGWLQLFEFYPDLNRIDVKTYSPTLDQYELDGDSQFSFDFDFNQRFNFLLAPTASVVEPTDQGPADLDPAYDTVLVATEQAHFRIKLTDANDGVDDTTVTAQTVTIARDGAPLTESVDYTFVYDPAEDLITLTSTGGAFRNGLYEITFNNGAARIADWGGNELTTDLLRVEIDTSIPQMVVFQQGVQEYSGTLDTDVRGAAPNNQYSTSTSIRADAENSGSPIHGLLQFQNIFGSGPGQIPIGSQIRSASLEFAATDNGNNLMLHCMLRDWTETETWNTLGAGIQADDIEAAATADASTGEVAIGTLSIDVTASLIAWANNPAANFGWAILPTGSNGVMLDSSEGIAPPKLTVTFGGTVVDTTAPTATLLVPLDQGPNDLDPAERALVVNTTQPYYRIRLDDLGNGIDDATVTDRAVAIRKDDVVLTESGDYTFYYDPSMRTITLTPMGGSFDEGLYEIILNGDEARIADLAGNDLAATTFTVEIDTSISLPQTVVFQQGLNGYAGMVDTHVEGSTPDSEYSTSATIDADAQSSGFPVHGLLRFEGIFGSEPGRVPVGAQITSAHLELSVVDTGNSLMFHRMLRAWADTETWNTLGSGIQANDIEAVSTFDASTGEVVAGTLSIDVTASLVEWASNPSANLGWAILNAGSNGVMLESSENITPPKLIVTFVTASGNNPPTVALANTVTALPEDTDTTVRVKVADIVVTDDGSGTNLLSLTGADADSFEIDGTELYLKAGTALDHETHPVLDVTVEVDDPAVGTTPDNTAALTIGITDVNEPPTVALVNPLTTLAENADTSVRLQVAEIVVTDDALGGNALTLTGDDAALFEIEAAILYLKAGTILNAATNPVLDVTVEVDDATVGATPDATVALAIAVTEVNNPPTVALANAVTALPEDTDTTTRVKVADIVITDNGVGVNSLNLSGADAALFEINGSELYLKAGTILDHETYPFLNVTVEVDDPAAGTTPDDTTALTISITDVNEPPTVALLDSLTTLAEDADTSVRIQVAEITVTDDALGSNALTLTGDDAALFEIEAAILYLKAGTFLNAATDPVLDVTVEVDDATVGATPDATVALAIAVTGSAPQTVTFQEGMNGYTGTVDTDVRGAAPDNQYSTSTSVRVDGQNGNYPIHALLRFDDIFGSGPSQVPVGTQIASAQLELRLSDNGNALTLHRMLRNWVETETWNTLDAGILADDVEAVSSPDAVIDEMILGTVSIDVTASLIAWANNPSTNFGWALLPTGSNGVMFDSSEGLTPPKLTITFGGSIVDATAPTSTLIVPLDQGLNDLDPTENAVGVSVSQPYFQVQLQDQGQGIDDATVTDPTLIFSKDGGPLTESADYSFAYDPATDQITLVATSGTFDDGLYEITLNGGAAKIADLAGNNLVKTTFTVAIDTSVSIPQTVTFEEGMNGYTGTVDTDVRGAAPDNQYSTSTSVRVDGQNGNYPIHALLRFDDIFGSGPGQIPVGTQIASAQLELRLSDNGNALTLHRLLRNWVESETWNTLDAGIQADDVEAVSSPDAVIAERALGTVSIDVTASLIAWANNPSANFGWALLPTGSDGVMFDSSEGPTPPTLTVTFVISSGNAPPTVDLANALTILPEDTDTTNRLKVADIVITDDGSGVNLLSLTGANADAFEINGTELYLKAGTALDHEAYPLLEVTVEVSDPAVGTTPDDTAALAIDITDVNEPPAVTLVSTLTTLAEDTDTTDRIPVADIVITDDALGTNDLGLTGTDAPLFEIESTTLYLKAGTLLDYDTNPILHVTVTVDDAAVSSTPDGAASLAITITAASQTTTYYVSQSGTGDGSTVDTPAGIDDFNAGTGPFATLDDATVYFLGTITTTIDPPDSGAEDARIILRGDYLGQECLVAGGGSLAVGIDIDDDDYITVVHLTVQNTTADAIRVGSAAVGTLIEGCTIHQSAGRGIALQSPATLAGNTLTATAGTQSIYSLLGPSGGAVTITGNTFNFNHAGSGLFIDGYGDHIIEDNDIHFWTGTATLLNNYGTSGETGSVVFTANDIDSSVAPAGPLISIRYGDWAVTIADNTFDLTATDFNEDVIYLTDLAGPTVSGNSIQVADSAACVHLNGNGQNTVATITHNAFTHTNGDGNGYIIRVGEESTGPDDNTYDGVVITDNLITGSDPFGNCHAVFVGFNRNAVIARNYIRDAGYGVVVKGTEGTDYTAGGVTHNVIYNCDIALRIKGVDDVVVASNTIYAPHALILTANVGGDESTGVVLKNNIFTGTGGSLLQIGTETDTSSISTADYATNCLYGFPPSDYVKYQGVNYTYAEWAALGYDNGSINADPLFTNLAAGNLTLQAGSPCIDVGTNLGPAYSSVLNPLSTWPSFVDLLDQEGHGLGWEIGAYVFI